MTDEQKQEIISMFNRAVEIGHEYLERADHYADLERKAESERVKRRNLEKHNDMLVHSSFTLGQQEAIVDVLEALGYTLVVDDTEGGIATDVVEDERG